MRFGPLVLTALLLAAAPFVAQADTLYDGAGNQTPDQAPWNWIFSQFPTSPGVKDTTSNGATTLDTSAANSAYTLTANDAPLLSGSLHTYPASPGTPYNQSNFLFVGDDTTSASAIFRLARVTAAVPEPGEIRLLAGWSLLGLLALRRRHQSA